VEGVLRLMGSAETRPVNIGNPVEYTVREIAELIVEIASSQSSFVHEPLPEDDPKQRLPDTTRAREVLGWEPRVGAREGLQKTLAWFAGRQAESRKTPIRR
jgi:nucleoside-diphosphate-sugar epimerase